MHLDPIDVSPVPKYRRIPVPYVEPRRSRAIALPALEAKSPWWKRSRGLVAVVLAWEISQIAIGVYYGVKLALAVT